MSQAAPAAHSRDRAGRGRDVAGDARDASAVQRDLVADERDRAAMERLQGGGGFRGWRSHATLLRQLTVAHQDAADARDDASENRRAGAGDRYDAGCDRRDARADRAASAAERSHASLDALTGAYERSAGFVELQRDLDRAVRLEESLVVAFVDVDGLKSVNDKEGHAAGDQLLHRVVDAMRKHLRSHDLIIRYGGDEFLCALGGVTRIDVASRFASVNHLLAQSQASVTVGLATLQPRDTVADLVTRADVAFYTARSQR